MKAIWLSVLLLAGCATAPPPIETRIESDPPGARVFYSVGINAATGGKAAREYVGSTPCTTFFPQKSDGNFDLPSIFIASSFVPPVIVITADPPSGSSNLFTKTMVFHGGTVGFAADKVPRALFFDLTKP